MFGVGDPQAKVLVIGEAPGFHEDRLGEPFVGAAGKLLDEMLASAGLSRKPGGGAYIANVLKHRPPENRDPEASEIAACTPILDEQIGIVDPRVIVTVGNFATRYVLDTEEGITRLRGRTFRREGRVIFPTFHPAAALRSTAVDAQLRADFRKLAEMLAEAPSPNQTGSAGLDRAPEGGGDSPAAPELEPMADQLELF